MEEVRFERPTASLNDIIIRILATNETITLKNQMQLAGGVEQIVFKDGTVLGSSDAPLDTVFQNRSVILGTAGNDTIADSNGSDTIIGGLGDDAINSAAGGDLFIYATGDGNDRIIDYSGSTVDVDVLRFTDINPEDVYLSRSGQHLKVINKETGHAIQVEWQFYSATENWGVERMEFANGTVWGRADIAAAAKWVIGTAGDDTLARQGSTGSKFIGGLGNDVLNGSGGSDIYYYSKGDGNDYINDESASRTDVDILHFNDVNSTDVFLTRSGVHSILTIAETGQTITLDEQFYNADYWGVDRIEFADGVAWGRTNIRDLSWIRGTAGNDTLGGSGGYVFAGGLGNDTINAGAGSDTFNYSKGDGNDYLNDESSSTTDVDTLRFNDVASSDVYLTRSGVHSVITIKDTGQTITLDEQFYSSASYYGIDRIEFSDGVVWGRTEIQAQSWIRGTAGADTLTGTSSKDTLYGATGDDVLRGGAGSDTFVFQPGFGHDTLADFVAGAGTDDVLDLGSDVFSDFASVMAAATQIGADTLITHDLNNSILLKNVTLANLHQDDFRFTAA